MTAKPQLVYIAAMSRSGSTLLDVLLDQHSQIMSVGELHVLPHDALDAYGALPCGCTREIRSCPIWSHVLNEVKPLAAVPPRLHHFRETHQWGPTLRPQMLIQRMRQRVDEQAAARYLVNTMAVVEAAAQRVEQLQGQAPRVVVDSSKDPYRLHWLALAPESSVRVIHLTRDPRAVVNSLTRDVGALQQAAIAARRMIAWLLENSLMTNTTSQLAPERYLNVRYEDLATDPDTTLAKIHHWLDLAPEALGQPQTTDSHAVGGNPMRRREMTDIVLDTRWRTELPNYLQRAIALVVRPFASVMGKGIALRD